jgi:DNA-binding GntR family transcriptional regulator
MKTTSRINQIEAIPRKTLHEELVERLRDILIEGDLEAGSKVPERELCERLGVSRTPLREALKVLAVDGLLSLIPNRGAVVRGITVDEINELFPIIGALEALAGELACACISGEEIEAIKTLHENMLVEYQARNLSGYFHYNQLIHEAILAASHNQILIEQYKTLSTRLRRARYFANLSKPRWAEAVAEHVDMLDALLHQDAARLGAILRSHLDRKHRTILDQLEVS